MGITGGIGPVTAEAFSWMPHNDLGNWGKFSGFEVHLHETPLLTSLWDVPTWTHVVPSRPDLCGMDRALAEASQTYLRLHDSVTRCRAVKAGGAGKQGSEWKRMPRADELGDPRDFFKSSVSRGSADWEAAALRMLQTNKWQDMHCVEGLQMGPLLGKGAHGRVYRGTYMGQPVAVKVMTGLRPEHVSEARVRIAALEAAAANPNFVKMLAYHVGPTPKQGGGGKLAGSPDQAAEDPSLTAWLVYEYCSRGTLLRALEKGLFRNPGDGSTNMLAITRIALQLARVIHDFHRQGLVHLDIAAANVMLAGGEGRWPSSLSAKLMDSSLAKTLRGCSTAGTKSNKKVTHTAPELLMTTCPPSESSDVYAFGVVCWELASHTRPWAKLLYPQVLVAVLLQREQLQFGMDVDVAYANLARKCMAHDPEERPHFHHIIPALLELELRYSRP